MPTPRHEPPKLDASRIRRRLLVWFDANRRDLPWRLTSDPYRVWVSEVMLQQTQVDRVVGYFNRFLDRFPDVHALAEAPVGEVLAVWEGLGYYGRARSMLRAAEIIVRQHGGALPSTVEELRRLPGFGRYTAAAVASISFGMREPAVDTNVHRVVARLALIEGPAAEAEPRRRVEVFALSLVNSRRPGDVNQALMDLGAAICRPRAPRCEACPVTGQCAALATGKPERWPSPRPRPKRTHRRELRALVVRRGRLLVVRRAEDGLLGGLWELPGIEIEAGSVDGESTTSLRAGVKGQTGIEIEPGGPIASFRLVFSHLEIDVTVVSAVATGGRLRRGAGLWATRDECAALPLTRATRKALCVSARPLRLRE